MQELELVYSCIIFRAIWFITAWPNIFENEKSDALLLRSMLDALKLSNLKLMDSLILMKLLSAEILEWSMKVYII
jgi:hypothetical protein